MKKYMIINRACGLPVYATNSRSIIWEVKADTFPGELYYVQQNGG